MPDEVFVFFGRVDGQNIVFGKDLERVSKLLASHVTPLAKSVEVEAAPFVDDLTFEVVAPKGVKRPGPSFLDRFRGGR